MTRKIVRLSICVILIVGLFLSNVPSGLAHWINDESDTLTHGIVRHASMVSDGAQGNSDSWKAIISADGRYMAYSSFVSNQVGGETDSTWDVLIQDNVAVVANFTADPTQGIAPLDVIFHNLSSGDDLASLWDFGDGITSTLTAPTHTYTTPGLYTVTLTASGPGGTDTLQKPAFIAVDEFATWRVSVSTDGSQGNMKSQIPSLSTGGRYVAFSSSASNLVVGDTNGVQDIFVHDRQSGLTQRVSLVSGGAQGNNSSQFPSISDDGRYVAFASQASNLVAGDTNNAPDVFIHDRQAGDTRRISLDSDGNQANGGSGLWNVSISADGHYVSFDSTASNLVTGDTNGTSDIFVYDLQTGATWCVSVVSTGAQSNGNSQYSTISADGLLVAFESDASNLVADDTNGTWDVFVHDRQTGVTQRVSLASDGSQGNSVSVNPAISADGRYVAFDSLASNLVTGDTNNVRDVFVHDRQLGLTRRVSQASDGGQGNSGSGLWRLAISADGRYVAFASNASNLVADDDNNVGDVFVHAWNTGDTLRVSTSPGGIQANGTSANPSISPDGCYIAYDSSASNLVAGDTNGARDVFVSTNPAYAPLLANFTAEPTRGHVPLTVAFTNQTDGFFTSSLWDFGDGVTSTLTAPTHTYMIPGVYTVTLTAGGLNRTNTRQKPAYIHVEDQILWRVSVAADGNQADNSSLNPSLSADGSLVAFESDASNLVAWDINKARDVFVHSPLIGVTQRVSLASDETQGDSVSSQPVLSANGLFVVFSSSASNLVAGDTNGAVDIFVRDRQAGVTERVSLASDGTQGNAESGGASVSADGRYVAFSSVATNLVAGDTNGTWDVFVHDRQTGFIQRVSIGSSGVQGNGVSDEASISADGRYVVFSSDASNLVTGDFNNKRDVFVHDRQMGFTQCISLTSDGMQGNGDTNSPVISADGRYVAFASDAGNLVSEDTNQHRDVFVHDRQANLTQRISVAYDGAQSNGNSGNPSISGDGRYVAFNSEASNLVAGDTNGQEDVFVYALWTGETRRISEVVDGTAGNGPSYTPSISADGNLIVYTSNANNLVAGDTNNAADIFLSANPTYTPVEARFNAEPRQGHAPLTVTFTIQTAGEFTTSLLDFGDGAASTTTSPTHTYSAPGSYTVTLTASGPNGSYTIACPRYITVYERLGQLTRVSVASNGTQVDGGSRFSNISADGRFVAFDSDASNLVYGDTNGASDIFVHDRQNGETTRASLGSGGFQGNGSSYKLDISSDGRFVVFPTLSDNLVAGDTNGTWDTFVYDRLSRETTLVSVASDGTRSNGSSGTPAISAGGRFVVFESWGNNLVDGDTNDTCDIFVHDRKNDETHRISIASNGTQGNDISVIPSISADGSFVTFTSPASSLVDGDTNGTYDVFIHDRRSGETRRISVSPENVQGNNDSFNPIISLDGRFISFTSTANNLVAGDTNNVSDIFVHDLQTRKTIRVSMSSDGSQANGWSGHPVISADGRFVAFTSNANNLVSGDTNGVLDIFVHDNQSGKTRRVSLASGGSQGCGDSDWPAISADGRVVSFQSAASNLVSDDTNGQPDIFVNDLGSREPSTVQADFSASPLTGMDTLTVSFTNQISGDYTTSLWFFGDGETSLQPSPTHTYTAPGVYNVMLFASGPGGTDTLTRPAYIVVHGAYSHYLPLVIK